MEMEMDTGMTNEQYKGLLLDELEDWEELLELVQEANDDKVLQRIENQISKIHQKLNF